MHLVAFGCIFPGVSFGGGGWGVAFWGWNGWDFSIFVAFCAIFGPFCDLLRRFGGRVWGDKWGNFFITLPFPTISAHLVGVQLWGRGLKW